MKEDKERVEEGGYKEGGLHRGKGLLSAVRQCGRSEGAGGKEI